MAAASAAAAGRARLMSGWTSTGARSIGAVPLPGSAGQGDMLRVQFGGFSAADFVPARADDNAQTTSMATIWQGAPIPSKKAANSRLFTRNCAPSARPCMGGTPLKPAVALISPDSGSIATSCHEPATGGMKASSLLDSG